jgi:hypothetical protein
MGNLIDHCRFLDIFGVYGIRYTLFWDNHR